MMKEPDSLHSDKNLSRLKNVRLGMINSGCGHSGHWTLKSAVSQQGFSRTKLRKLFSLQFE